VKNVFERVKSGRAQKAFETTACDRPNAPHASFIVRFEEVVVNGLTDFNSLILLNQTVVERPSGLQVLLQSRKFASLPSVGATGVLNFTD
jgi:hypothetical protein